VTNINWDLPFHVDPSTLLPSDTGIPVPTYGNFGGPGYTNGIFVGSGQIPDPTPVDALDFQFMLHDQASAAAQTTAQQVAADLTLIAGIEALKPSQLDAEARLYAGATTLAMIEQLAVTDSLDLLPPKQLVHVVRDAVQNLEHGLHKLPALDVQELQQVIAQNPVVIDVLDTAVDLAGSLHPSLAHAHALDHGELLL
jgi:hypothetical protein